MERMLAAEIENYLAELVGHLRDQLEDRLVGAWLFGSGALGDLDPATSDLDVQAVTTVRLVRAERESLAARVSHPALACPVRGLELVLYAQEDLDDPLGPAFQLNLNTGPRMAQHAANDPQGGQAALAAARAWAWAEEGRWLAKGPAAAWLTARVARELQTH